MSDDQPIARSARVAFLYYDLDEEPQGIRGCFGDEPIDRREILRCGVAFAGASGLAFGTLVRADAQAGGEGPMDAKSEARKIAFDRSGKGDKVY